MNDFWVFGYGSLMWNPGFPYQESVQAQIFGYRRSLCIHSHVHRGTPENPGLVLGLDRGGSCRGIAFRVSHEDRHEVLAYLRERELVTHVYKEKVLSAVLSDKRQIQAVSYVADRCHDQYAGMLDHRNAAEIVRNAVGQSGPNLAYVLNTVSHLREIGIRDHLLEGIGRMAAEC